MIEIYIQKWYHCLRKILFFRGGFIMDINKVLEMYNDGGKSLVEIAKEMNTSKSTLSRFLAREGYIYNKKMKQYLHETVNTENNGTELKVLNDSEKIVTCTFGLPASLYKALKVKCAVEGSTMVEVARKALEDVIEKKYFEL